MTPLKKSHVGVAECNECSRIGYSKAIRRLSAHTDGSWLAAVFVHSLSFAPASHFAREIEEDGRTTA